MSGNSSSSPNPQSNGDRTGGASTPDGESEPRGTGAESPSPGQAEPKSPYARGDRSLISDLIRRRVPQVLAGYLGVTWTLFEFMQWLTNNYLVSPYLGRVVLFGLLMLAPAVILVTYRHGRPGPDQWTSLERWGTAANVLLVLLVLGFAYGDAELGSMVKTVQAGPSSATGQGTVGDTSAATARQVPKKEFRKQVSLFYFDESEDAEADTSLRRAAPVALHHDLGQDNFVSTRFVDWHSNRLRERNYEDGLNVPLALKREIAQWEGSEYILSGSVGRPDERFRLTTRLHDTNTGEELASHTFEGEEFFPVVDQASKQLKKDLQLPQAHLESVADLPVTQVLTSSLEAAKKYGEGFHSEHSFDTRDKHRRAVAYFSKAAEMDSTFALAHAHKGWLHWAFGRKERARQSLQKARRHDYRLTESEKYSLETYWLSVVEQRLEDALQLSEQWTDLHPYDIDAWKRKASIHENLLEYQSTLESYQYALEVFPKSKELQFKVGAWLEHTGDLQGAARHFTSLTEKYPDESAWYQWLGLVRWRMGNLESAEESFRAVRRIDSEASEAWLSSLYQATGRFDQALEILKQSTSGREAERQDGYRLLHHYRLTGQLKKSKFVLDSLWTAEVDYPDFHRFYLSERACSYQTENNFYDTEKYVSNIRIFKKKYGKTIPSYKTKNKVQLANCLKAVDSLDRAEYHLAAADSIVDQTRPALRRDSHLDFFLGRVQEERGNYSQAARHYERFLKIHAAHSSPLIWSLGRPRLQLAIAYQKAESVEKARGAYQDAIAVYPAHPEINFRYGQFLAEQEEIDQAQTHLRRAVKGWARADSSFAPKQRARALLDSLDANAV